MNPSLAAPSFFSRMRKSIADSGEKWNLLGIRRFVSSDEFVLPGRLCFAGPTLRAFRRAMRLRYESLKALNAAWGRDYASWKDVRPDGLDEAVQRRNLVSWALHREFMETLVLRYRERAERYLQEFVPGARVDMANNSEESADTGVDFARHLRAAGLHSQYDGRDFIRKRDFRRPDAELGVWMPFNLGRSLHWSEAMEAHFKPHQYLLEGYNTYLTWWGFEDFGWPFLRPDLTPVEQFKPMVREFRAIGEGLDRFILGAERENLQVAGLFSQPSFRTVHALRHLAKGKAPLRHDWELAAEALSPLHIRGHVILPQDLLSGRPDLNQTKLLVLLGAVALEPQHVAALESFVARGGCLVADVLPGGFSRDSALQSQEPIASLFGVAAPSGFPDKGTEEPQPIQTAGPFAAARLLDAPACVPGLTASVGKAKGKVGESPAFVEHTQGRGKTLLLNFPLRTGLGLADGMKLRPPRTAEEAGRRTQFAQALAKWAGVQPGIEVSSEPREGLPWPPPGYVFPFRDGRNLVIGIYNPSYDRSEEDRSVTLKVPDGRYFYDVSPRSNGDRASSGRRPGPEGPAAREHTVTVPRWRAGYYYLAKERLPDLEATASATPDGEIRVQLTGGQDRRIVVVRARDPEGRERSGLRGEVEFTGKGEVMIPVAISDPRGAWEIRVRDVIAGQVIRLAVDIPKP